jgi:hypothetical protein
MADLRKLKRRNTLGAPPPLEEASQNLKAPEVAPATVQHAAGLGNLIRSDRPPEEPPTSPLPRETVRADGRRRSHRKTGRTLQFATKVTWEFDDRLRRVADRDGKLLVEVLELALDAYEKIKDSDKVEAI